MARDTSKAEYYIRLRKIKEEAEYYSNIMDRENRQYTFIIGQLSDERQSFLKECGFTLEMVGHIKWKLEKINLTPTS